MSSSSRSTKRKRYSDIKHLLVNDLHKLAVDSGNFNNELLEANEDFVAMFKSMEDRIKQHLSSSLLIEEKYRDVTAIVKEGKPARFGGRSSEIVQLPPEYKGDTRKFIEHSSTSLTGHAKSFTEHVEEMVKVFQNYSEVWNQKLNDLKAQAEVMEEERASLATQLSDFVRNM